MNFSKLKEYRKILNVIDVGCSHYIDKEWEKHKESIKFFLGFDPFGESPYIDKRFPKNRIYNCAIFDKEGDHLFYICNYNRCSSLFPPNPEVIKNFVKKVSYSKKKVHRFDIKKTKQVKCIRLDTILSDLEINFDFIKTDTQGADYNVLKSLGKYLNEQIVGVKLEHYFQPIYKGIALYNEVNRFLNDNGFVLVKKFSKPSKFTRDFLYIRKDNKKSKQIKLIKKIYKV